MLHGFDISHHNGTDAIANCAAYMASRGMVPDFVFIKATEGKSFVDSEFHKNMQDAAACCMLRGAYHYARPEINDYSVEVHNFLSQFDRYIKDYNTIPILDWEDKALKCNANWAYEWCKAVYKSTGIKPLLYTGVYELPKHKKLCSEDYGLWLARWRDIDKGSGSVAPWGFYTAWQYTNTPFDMSVFNGERDQFLKYCQPIGMQAPEVEPDEDCFCGCSNCGKERGV